MTRLICNFKKYLLFCNFFETYNVQPPEHFKEKENINETAQNHQAGNQS